MRCAKRAARWIPTGLTPPWPSKRPRRARPGPARARRRMRRLVRYCREARHDRFLGYDTETPKGRFWRWCVMAHRDDAAEGEVQIVLNQTPFYAESGGQVGDAGLMRDRYRQSADHRHAKRWRASSAYRRGDEGEIATGRAPLEVDHARRARSARTTRRRTCCTRRCARRLGDHVAQRGSLNAPDRLRFDFQPSKAAVRPRSGAGRSGGQRV